MGRKIETESERSGLGYGAEMNARLGIVTTRMIQRDAAGQWTCLAGYGPDRVEWHGDVYDSPSGAVAAVEVRS